MLKKILTSFIYTLIGFSLFIVFFPWILIKLNTALNLPVVSFSIKKPFGLLFFLLGAVNYLYCHKYFLFQGNRTPLITETSHKLLNTGLYKYSRNPIYIGHIIMLLGLFFFFGHLLLLVYCFIAFLTLHLLVVFYEEPRLKKSLGKEYESYLHQVPRWL